MSRLPAVTARQVMAVLERSGFVLIRTKGSHYFYQHRNDPRRHTVIAYHRGDVPKGTRRDILKDIGLTVEEFLDRL